MRFNKCLKRLNSKIKRYQIHSFDIETHGYKNRFVIGGFYDDRYHAFFNKDELIDYMMSKSSKNSFIVASNLSFDFFGTFFDKRYMNNFSPIMKSGNILMSKIGMMRFIDTRNFCSLSVSALGKIIGLEKFYSRFAKSGTIPKTINEWNSYKRYNARDCLISKKFIEYFQDVCNNVLGCEMKMTIASSAMNLYRRRFMPIPIIYKEPFNEKKFIYSAYYGGRTEAFFRGHYIGMKRGSHRQKLLYYYDFNSLYPSCMKGEYPLPVSAKIIKSRRGNIPENIIIRYHGISDVIIEAPYMFYPFLPFRSENKLLFPYGTFRGSYTHIELRKALELGYRIKKIFKTLYYTKTFFPFRDYVNTLYDLRMRYQHEGNLSMASIVKLFLNSLYGKFAMKNLQEITIKDFSIEELEEGYFLDHKSLIGYKTREKEAENNYIIPILSVYTSAYSRIKLYDAIVRLEPLYCDTDSCLSFKKIRFSQKLGEMKLEKVVKECIIVRPKLYQLKAIDGKIFTKAKGFSRINDKDFRNIIRGKKIKQMQFIKFKESIRRNYEPNQKINFYKRAILEDDKRKWSKTFNPERFDRSNPIFLKFYRREKQRREKTTKKEG